MNTELIFKFVSPEGFYIAIKAILFTWLFVEAGKRLYRYLRREPSGDFIWSVSIIISAFTAFALHRDGVEAPLNPALFFALFVGLATPVIHHIIFVQLAHVLEEYLSNRFGIEINIRAALTGNPRHKRCNGDSHE